MKILLYGINYSPELTGIGKYSGEMAQWLAAQGHEVRVVTAPPYYPDWKVWDGFSAWRYQSAEDQGVRVTRCPLYVPPKPTALKRIAHLLSFSLSSSLALLANVRWKPDTVMLVVPTLFCVPQALLVAKLAGAQAVLHVQDYEVDAMFGTAGVSSSRLKRMAFAVERFLLRRFDRVSTISSGMLKRAEEKGVAPERLMFFPNWSEVERFQGVEKDQALLQHLGAMPGQRVVLYSGNIGDKQGLETVIDAARHYSDQPDIVFLIVGDGAGKQRLQDSAQAHQLANVLFAPLQPYELLPALLASAECHLVVQKRSVADAVLPSKLTNILAVGGNALITADADTSLGELCTEYPGIAVRVEPESPRALIEGIAQVLNCPRPNSVAASYATENLDKNRILKRFVAELQQQPEQTKRQCDVAG